MCLHLYIVPHSIKVIFCCCCGYSSTEQTAKRTDRRRKKKPGEEEIERIILAYLQWNRMPFANYHKLKRKFRGIIGCNFMYRNFCRILVLHFIKYSHVLTVLILLFLSVFLILISNHYAEYWKFAKIRARKIQSIATKIWIVLRKIMIMHLQTKYIH